MNWREISIAVPQKTSETHPHAAAATRRTYRWLLEPILPLIERCKNFRISRPRTPEARISPKEIFSRVSPSSRIGGFSRYPLVIDQRLRSKGLHYGDWLVDGCGDPWRWLRRQAELEPVDDELEFGFGVGVAGEQDLAPVGGRQMNVDHLDGGKFFERAARSQSGRQGIQTTGQGDLHAVGQKGDEDVGLDPLLVLMEDRTNREIALEIAERLFDGNELRVVLPELGGIIVGKIGAQQISAFAPPCRSQFLAIEREAEAWALFVHLDIDQTPGGRRLGARAAEFHQQLFARQLHGGDLPELLQQHFQLPPPHPAFFVDP